MERVAEIQTKMQTEVAEIKRIEGGKYRKVVLAGS